MTAHLAVTVYGHIHRYIYGRECVPKAAVYSEAPQVWWRHRLVLTVEIETLD